MIVNKYQGNGGGSGSGSTVSWRQDLSAGTQIAQITINGTSQNVYAPEGGAGSDDVVYEYDAITAMTQQERAALFIELSGLTADSKRIWIHRLDHTDDYWFLIDTINSLLLGFTSKNQDSFTRFVLKSDGRYSQTKQLYLPKATSSTLGGVKVGSGLTIDGSGVLSVSGGTGGDSNYVIVDALSAITDPVEGMIAYVSGHSYIQVINCTKVQPNSNFSFEGMIARIKNANNDVVKDVYMSGENFYWDYTNDGEWHTMDIWTGEVYLKCSYLCHNDGTTGNGFIIFDNSSPAFDGTGVYVEVEVGQEANVDLNTNFDYNVPVFELPKFYQYQGGAWQVIAAPDVYNLEDMSQQELVALYNKIFNAYYGGETDFSSWKFYGYNRSINTPFEFRGINDGYVRFASVVAKWDDPAALYNRSLSLNSAGTFEEWNSEIRNFEARQLTVLRERQYLVCDKGTHSGYTIDLSQVPNDTVAVNYDEPSWSWLFKVRKDSEGYYRDGDGYEWSERSTYQLKERFERRCQYYWKRTGDTMTVIFVKDAPASDSDMNFDASVSYTAITDTVDFLYTNTYWSDPNNPEPIYTGNTCSGEWAFDNEILSIIDGESDPQKKMPVFSFICASGTTGMKHFAYPIAHYEEVPEVQLYDKDGSGPFTFNKRIYFDYGEYVISILGGQGEYRYAQLTVEAK